MGGPDIAMLPHCPPVPSDTDPEILALQQQGMLPLTPAEFDEWVAQQGNAFTSSKARVQDTFTDHKIQRLVSKPRWLGIDQIWGY